MPRVKEDEDEPPAKRAKRSLYSLEESKTVNATPTSSDAAVDYSKDAHSRSGEDVASVMEEQECTGLEVSLPCVKTGREAVKEYEAAKESGLKAEDFQQRLDSRCWTKGKSSIYVDAFNLALETVLEQESHLFDQRELAVFQCWRNLSYEAQFLYVRLFLRKKLVWHRIHRLSYSGDIANISAAVKELQQQRNLSTLQETDAEDGRLPSYGKDDLPELGPLMTFADSSEGEEGITNLEDACSILLLDELKAIAKEARVQGKTKSELIKNLRQTSKGQSCLSWPTLRRNDTKEEPSTSADSGLVTIGSCGTGRDDRLLRRILAITGPCIRLSATPCRLFERIHLVFYRSTEWTENSLTTIILARISRRNFPQYIVCRSANIFPSRETLLEFEEALRTQFTLDSLLELSGPPTADRLRRIREIFEDAYPRWKLVLQEEQHKEDKIYETGEGAYLRRFSPGWVYTRIVHKALLTFARCKDYKKEYQVLSELLRQRLFHLSRRGGWYQRKALLEEHYMWACALHSKLDAEGQKKQWRKRALRTCEEGLEDRDCHVIYHYDLQKRITHLERVLHIPKREQHEFDHVRLAKALERTIEGIRVDKGQLTHEHSSTAAKHAGKTVWINEWEEGEEKEKETECSVESMCLNWYRAQGWKGYHSEGGIMRTLFGYLFYDVLFTYVPNVFQTPFQVCPLDLHTDAFYPARFSEINTRLTEIANGYALHLLKEVYSRGHKKQTCVIGIDWAFEYDDLEQIVSCFPGQSLATLCKVMAEDYQQRSAGMPDLFLWHPAKKQVMFAEVKSENDRLSDKQRVWIHILCSAGVRVELCHAVAREVRAEAG